MKDKKDKYCRALFIFQTVPHLLCCQGLLCGQRVCPVRVSRVLRSMIIITKYSLYWTADTFSDIFAQLCSLDIFRLSVRILSYLSWLCSNKVPLCTLLCESLMCHFSWWRHVIRRACSPLSLPDGSLNGERPYIHFHGNFCTSNHMQPTKHNTGDQTASLRKGSQDLSNKMLVYSPLVNVPVLIQLILFFCFCFLKRALFLRHFEQNPGLYLLVLSDCIRFKASSPGRSNISLDYLWLLLFIVFFFNIWISKTICKSKKKKKVEQLA